MTAPNDQDESQSPKSVKPSRSASAAAKPLTPERIRNIAEHYVGQRESSAQMLREVLHRRLLRRLRSLDPEAAAEEKATAVPLIEAEVERLERAGLINDARYAEMKARSALARGRGSRRILRDLGQKGVSAAPAREALVRATGEALENVGQDLDASEVLQVAEFEAALTFTRKKRLGPYRVDPLPEAWAEASKVWRREAAALARAGFGVGTIRRVLDRAPETE
jgi:regulatory protein